MNVNDRARYKCGHSGRELCGPDYIGSGWLKAQLSRAGIPFKILVIARGSSPDLRLN